MVQSNIRASGEDFDFFFLTAINSVVNDLLMETVIDVSPINETSPPAEITAPANCANVFYEGTMFYLQKNALWARQNEELNDAYYRRALAQVQGDALEDAPTGLDYEIT